MRKHQLLPQPRHPPILLIQPPPIPLHHPPKHRPLHPTHQPPLPPRRHLLPALPRLGMRIQETNNMLAPLNPFIPIPPHERPFIPLRLKELNPIMQFPHSLSDLLRRLRIAEVLWREGGRNEVLLKPPIPKRPQQSRTNLLARESAQDA